MARSSSWKRGRSLSALSPPDAIFCVLPCVAELKCHREERGAAVFRFVLVVCCVDDDVDVSFAQSLLHLGRGALRWSQLREMPEEVTHTHTCMLSSLVSSLYTLPIIASLSTATLQCESKRNPFAPQRRRLPRPPRARPSTWALRVWRQPSSRGAFCHQTACNQRG